jgi:hypothetical protein
MNLPNANISDLLDWQALPEESIELSPEQINQALQQSQQCVPVNQQWQVYLQALALCGLEEWLAAWAPDLRISNPQYTTIQNTTIQSATSDALLRVCGVTIQGFKLYALATGQAWNDQILMPKPLVDIENVPPFGYLWVEVWEEEMQVRVAGYLTSDTLRANSRNMPLTLSADGTYYEVPTTWFNPNLSDLVLDIHCLTANLSEPVFAEPTVLETPAVVPSGVNWSGMSQGMTRGAINTALWLNDCLDELAQALAWNLMPGLATASALRSQSATIPENLLIPDNARGALYNFSLGNLDWQLQVICWPLVLPEIPQAWTLVVVLKRPSGQPLPAQTYLRLRDESQILVEQGIMLETEIAAPATYLYAQVGGHWHEQFWLTIDLADGVSMTLPPLTFSP